MAFSVLLVDYNSIEDTLKYIQLCETYLESSVSKEYIIVDNSLSGNGYEYLYKNYEFVAQDMFEGCNVIVCNFEGIYIHCIRTLNNGGYAKGNNLAARYSGKLFPNNNFIISNNDILFLEKYNIDEIDNLLKKYAVIGPDVITEGKHTNPVYYSGPIYNLFAIYVNSFLPLKIRPKHDNIPYTFVGCFWFFNKYDFYDIGGFDENTFLYYEEPIIGEKLKKSGKKLLYYKNMCVIHNHDFSRKSACKEAKTLRIFYKSARYYEDNYIGVPVYLRFLSRLLFEILILIYIPERAVLKWIFDVKKSIKKFMCK